MGKGHYFVDVIRLVQTVIVVGQILMVTYGGRALRTHSLSFNQHLGCIFIASFSMLMGLIVKLVPLEVEDEKTNKEVVFRSSNSLSRLKSKSRTLSIVKQH